MKKRQIHLFTFAIFTLSVSVTSGRSVQAQQQQSAYPAMAPKNQYLIQDKDSEIALARNAAPASISGAAEVQILGPDGYRTAAAGSNGFVCLVERGFATSTGDPAFWDPKVRRPICVNAPAARSYLPAVLLKTRLALQGRSTLEIAQTIRAAIERKTLPALEPNAMSYMMSKQQYVDNKGKSWHPHIMLFVPGNQESSWGADRADSPVMATYDVDVNMTTFYFWVGNWSDGTGAPDFMH